MNEKLDIYIWNWYVNMNILKCLYVNWSSHVMAEHEDIYIEYIDDVTLFSLPKDLMVAVLGLNVYLSQQTFLSEK